MNVEIGKGGGRRFISGNICFEFSVQCVSLTVPCSCPAKSPRDIYMHLQFVFD
jgi:hypothetical protein